MQEWKMREQSAGVENAGVEKAGVDSRGGKCRSGKCRSDNLWKAVRIENSKIPVVYAQTVCERCNRVQCCCVSTNWTSFLHLYFFCDYNVFIWIASLFWQLSENYKHEFRRKKPPMYKNRPQLCFIM